MEVGSGPVPGRDPHAVDSYAPAEIAHRVRTAGVEDAQRPLVQTMALAIIGGGMLGIAAAASTAAMAGPGPVTGLVRVVGGLVFGLGLSLVMVGGGELFTSNNLIAMAWVSRKVHTVNLLIRWVVVYVGNAIGAVSISVLLVLGGTYDVGDGAVGIRALSAAVSKVDRSFEQHVALGILGNALVCLAVWLCFSARSTTDRILSCVLPMIGLVTLGVDHIVANLHYLSAGILLRTRTFDGVVPAELAAQVTAGPVARNLLGVTIGNLIGGSLLVAIVYWFVYLRDQGDARVGPPA